MLRRILFVCITAGCFGFIGHAAIAQEVVHALTGTVSSINPAGKEITLFLDSGSSGVFNEMENSKTSLSFDKKVREDTTAAAAFDKQGAYVILFYFGGQDNRTAVALRNLGRGPFASTLGIVTNFESRDHSITVKDQSGTIQSFKIDAKTVAEGDSGVVDGLRFQARKGDHVRIVGSSANGNPVALFVREM